MKIVVMGGAGFIGTNIADFYAPNNEVVVFDNLSRSERNFNYLKNKFPKISFIKGDIRNFDEVKPVLKDADIVFHTAAQVAVTTSLENPTEDFKTNSLGAFNVCEAARQSNRNPIVLFCSTNKVYGCLEQLEVKELEKRYEYKTLKQGVDLSFPLNPRTPYGCSKAVGDIYMQDYHATYGLRTVVFRMSCIYGPHQWGTSDQGWVSYFLLCGLLNKPLVIYGDGKQIRDILYVGDLVEAYNLAIKNISKTAGKVYNMGGGISNTMSLLELIDFMKEKFGLNLKYSFDKWRPSDQKVYCSNTKKAKEDFGWVPKTSKEEGLRLIYDWMKKNQESSNK